MCSLVLHLEALVSELIAVHMGNGSFGIIWLFKANEPKATASSRQLVDKNSS